MVTGSDDAAQAGVLSLLDDNGDKGRLDGVGVHGMGNEGERRERLTGQFNLSLFSFLVGSQICVEGTSREVRFYIDDRG